MHWRYTCLYRTPETDRSGIGRRVLHRHADLVEEREDLAWTVPKRIVLGYIGAGMGNAASLATWSLLNEMNSENEQCKRH